MKTKAFDVGLDEGFASFFASGFDIALKISGGTVLTLAVSFALTEFPIFMLLPMVWLFIKARTVCFR